MQQGTKVEVIAAAKSKQRFVGQVGTVAAVQRGHVWLNFDEDVPLPRGFVHFSPKQLRDIQP